MNKELCPTCRKDVPTDRDHTCFDAYEVLEAENAKLKREVSSGVRLAGDMMKECNDFEKRLEQEERITGRAINALIHCSDYGDHKHVAGHATEALREIAKMQGK